MKKYKCLAASLAILLSSASMNGLMGIPAADAAGTSPAQAAQTIQAADTLEAKLKSLNGAIFPIGEPNTANAAHFTGDSYVARLSDDGVPIANVTLMGHIPTGTSITNPVRYWWQRQVGATISCGVMCPMSCCLA